MEADMLLLDPVATPMPTPLPMPVTPEGPVTPLPMPVTPEGPVTPLPMPVTPGPVVPGPTGMGEWQFAPEVSQAIKTAYAQVRANFIFGSATAATGGYATIKYSPVIYGVGSDEMGHTVGNNMAVFKTYRPTYALTENTTTGEVTGWDVPVNIEIRYDHGPVAANTYIKVGQFVAGGTGMVEMEWTDNNAIYWPATNTAATTGYSYYNSSGTMAGRWGSYAYPKPDPKRRLQEIMDSRQAPRIIVAEHRKPITAVPDVREQRARYTLRRVIGEEKFKGLLKNGYISIRGKSGRVYQIFPGDGITAVYEGGKMIDRICVKLQGNFPATDNIIMRYLLILNNESEFERLGIKHRVFERRRFEVVQPKVEKNLVELFRELKKSA
jgi:hypothetical protein